MPDMGLTNQLSKQEKVTQRFVRLSEAFRNELNCVGVAWTSLKIM